MNNERRNADRIGFFLVDASALRFLHHSNRTSLYLAREPMAVRQP
jgi:hypothetical protein